jgi:hypothetical protein
VKIAIKKGGSECGGGIHSFTEKLILNQSNSGSRFAITDAALQYF